MADFEAFTEQYMGNVDCILEEYSASVQAGYDLVFGRADTVLRSLARTIETDPDAKILGYAGEAQKPTRTALALNRYASYERVGNEVRRKIQITPGELGPLPEDLKVGGSYKLNGFAVTEIACCSGLAFANISLGSDGVIEIDDPDRFTILEGENYRFLGEWNEQCGTCLGTIPHLRFNKVVGTGELERDKRGGQPIEYRTFPGLITDSGLRLTEAA